LRVFLKYINDHVLHKAANLNLAHISVKILAGTVITKFVAVLIGAEGMALMGNLRNFFSAFQSVSIGGMYQGMVKFISKFREDTVRLSETLSTAYYVGFLLTFLASLFCYYNAESISEFLFSGRYQYSYIIRLMGLLLPFYSLNMFSFSIMNGFSKFRILLVINIIGQVLGLLVTLVLIWQDNIDGALTSIVITPALVFLITLVGILWRRSLIGLIQFRNITVEALQLIAPHTVIAMLTSVSIPLVLILIRNYLMTEVGIKEAGYWQAVNRISDYYLMFMNSLLVLYVFPRLNSTSSTKASRAEIYRFYKSVMPYFAAVLLLIYVVRVPLIQILLTDEFKPAKELFAWQLFGDFLMVMAMVVALQFLAKRMFIHFIILQVFLFLILYISSMYFIDAFGVQGAVMAHCLSYGLYFAIILLLFASSLFGVISEQQE
jgi:O-antigen/teichoic acid export membrane protein